MAASNASGVPGLHSIPQGEYTPSETGAVRLLDYWKITKKGANPLSVVKDLAERLGVEFRDCGGGDYYRRGMLALDGAVKVVWENYRDPESVMVEVKGEGMRYWEGRDDFPGWRTVMRTFDTCGWVCRRLDVATDDRGYTVAYETVRSAFMNRDLACRALRGEARNEPGVPGGWHEFVNRSQSRPGRTLMAGSRQGETFFRAYEKGVQLKDEKPWLRFETEFKGARAEAAMKTYVHEGEDALWGMCRGFVEFKDPDHQVANVSDRRAAAWWEALMTAARYVVNLPQRARLSAEALREFMFKQMAGSVYAITAASGGCSDWLYRLLDVGSAKQKPHHVSMYRYGPVLT